MTKPRSIVNGFKLVIWNDGTLRNDFKFRVATIDSDELAPEILREWVVNCVSVTSFAPKHLCEILVNRVPDDQWLELFRWGLSKLED